MYRVPAALTVMPTPALPPRDQPESPGVICALQIGGALLGWFGLVGMVGPGLLTGENLVSVMVATLLAVFIVMGSYCLGRAIHD